VWSDAQEVLICFQATAIFYSVFSLSSSDTVYCPKKDNQTQLNSKAFLEHVMEHKQNVVIFKHASCCSFRYMYQPFFKHIWITNKAHLKHFWSTIKRIFGAQSKAF
jgi:hypothetical protein